MSKGGGDAAADGEKKYTVSISLLNLWKILPVRVIGIVRHQQKRNVESKPRIQEDSAEIKEQIQSRFKFPDQFSATSTKLILIIRDLKSVTCFY